MRKAIDLSALIDSLQEQEPGQAVRLVETHISWVLITHTTAYKIKKPVKFAFVDFRGIERRRHFCQEEVRLNQRLAPEVYLSVVPITYAPHSGRWSIDAASPAPHQKTVDWAVKMRAFNAQATLDQAQEIRPEQIDAVADKIALFHKNEVSVPHSMAFGSTQEIARLVSENLRELAAQIPLDPRIVHAQHWTEDALKNLDAFFTQRKSKGFIKECHGDLHLGNIAWENDRAIIFDCIEFSDTLRCIDVINEIAFLFMDLLAKGHRPMAWRLLNRWLEHTGDYEGLKGLIFYAHYRALVRAKISLHQGRPTEAERYLGLAADLTVPRNPALTLMHGFSGSGKTVESQRLLEAEGAVRVRSDVERKRLHGLDSATESQSGIDSGLYQELATQQTFDRLHLLAAALVQSGFAVILDATFLRRALRSKFISLANNLGVRARIIDMNVSPEVCRQRIMKRQAAHNDASEATLAVLDHQLASSEPFTAKELGLVEAPLSALGSSAPGKELFQRTKL